MPLRNLNKSEFDELDWMVMKCAFATQNTLGRFFDERVYEKDLMLRLKAAGVREVYTQVPLTVHYGDFKKEYFLDLVAANGLYELKAVTALNGGHEAQALNYAMLLEVSHVKLINFGSPRVEGKLRYTDLSLQERRQLIIEDLNWKALSDSCWRLKETTIALASDWGAFLDGQLYNEALIHFFGGEAKCVSRIPVQRNGQDLGSVLVQSHAAGMLFVLTNYPSDYAENARHLRRLLQCTSASAIQWINFHNRNLQFQTLTKK